jgi:hypothetical protein
MDDHLIAFARRTGIQFVVVVLIDVKRSPVQPN